MFTTPMAIITEVRLRPRRAAMPIASSSPGTASMMSATRMTSESTQPPKAPASRPRPIPTLAPMLTETMPMISE